MDALNTLQEQLEGIPGFDYVIDYYNDKVGSKYQTKDPFYVEVDGKSKRRKLPESFSKESKDAWKVIQRRAWLDDKNFFGCYPINLGFGLAPLLSLVPVLGPALMYAIHARMINIANERFTIPVKLVAKLQGNILFDLIISLIPIVGMFFTWINACSTRNAALIHSFIVEKELERLKHLEGVGPVGGAIDLGYSVRSPQNPQQQHNQQEKEFGKSQQEYAQNNKNIVPDFQQHGNQRQHYNQYYQPSSRQYH